MEFPPEAQENNGKKIAQSPGNIRIGEEKAKFPMRKSRFMREN